MPPNPVTCTSSQTQREASYTTPRADVFELVPPLARDILDVGCSNGALGRSLKAAMTGRSVSGIEVDSRFAREAAGVLDHVVEGNLNQLDWNAAFGERRFDCIIFADVLEHLTDPLQTLRQARAFLRPGGCVVVSLPNIRHLSSLVAIFLGGSFPQRDRGIFDRTHLRWFTITDAYALLSNGGFRVQSYNQALRWGDRGGGLMNRLLNRLPTRVQRWSPVREFLTYQICMRADVAG